MRLLGRRLVRSAVRWLLSTVRRLRFWPNTTGLLRPPLAPLGSLLSTLTDDPLETGSINEEHGPVFWFPEAEDVLFWYGEAMGCTEHQARDCLRGGGLAQIESACERPYFYAAYQEADIALQAAVFTHGIAET